MALVAISRGSYLRGTEVAVMVAGRLGCESVSRDVLLEASEQFNVPEAMLVRAMDDAPSFLERLTYGRESYLAYIRASLLSRLQRGNVVYHGFAGHLLLRDVGNLLKVRIVADLEERIEIVMEREGVAEDRARAIVEQADRERSRWSRHLHGVDIGNGALYHLCLNVSRLTVEGAADVICQAVDSQPFTVTPESVKELDDLALAARVKAALIRANPRVEVVADGPHVTIKASGSSLEGPHVLPALESLAEEVEGVGSVEIEVGTKSPHTRFSH